MMPEFTNLVDLASELLGGTVTSVVALEGPSAPAYHARVARDPGEACRTAATKVSRWPALTGMRCSGVTKASWVLSGLRTSSTPC